MEQENVRQNYTQGPLVVGSFWVFLLYWSAPTKWRNMDGRRGFMRWTEGGLSRLVDMFGASGDKFK